LKFVFLKNEDKKERKKLVLNSLTHSLKIKQYYDAYSRVYDEY